MGCTESKTEQPTQPIGQPPAAGGGGPPRI